MRTLFDCLIRSVLVVVLFGATQVFAAEKLKACFVEWPPYTRMIDGQPGGITVDIMKAAAERAGFDISFRHLPWQRCIIMVQRGEYDFALDAVERPGLIHGDHPNALYVQAFWLRNGDDYGPYEYVGKLVDKRLALMQGFQYSAKILNAGFPVIEWVPTEEVAGKMIMKNRLDLVFADVVVMQQAIRDHGLALKPMLPVFSTQPMYPSFNVGRRDKMRRMDDAIGAMHADGSLDEVYQQHTGAGFSDLVKISSQGRSLKP